MTTNLRVLHFLFSSQNIITTYQTNHGELLLCNKRTEARGRMGSGAMHMLRGLQSLCRQHYGAEGKPLLSFSGDKGMSCVLCLRTGNCGLSLSSTNSTSSSSKAGTGLERRNLLLSSPMPQPHLVRTADSYHIMMSGCLELQMA